MKRFFLFAISVGLLAIMGCGRPIQPNVVAIDLLHGTSWPGMEHEVERFGFRVRLLKTEADFRNLRSMGVLVIAAGDPEASRSLSAYALSEVEKFVRAGGGVLCAGESWSWTTGGRAERTLDNFPLNVLGKRLGFVIMDRTVRSPRNISPILMGGLEGLQRLDWWASEVRATVKGAETLITDDDLRPMAVGLQHGSGRVVVVGQRDLLRENPEVFRNMLIHLSVLDEHVL